MKKIILIILALFVISSQVYAGFTVFSAGRQTCGHFVKVMEGHRRGNVKDVAEYLAFISWVSGFETAVSLQSEENVFRGRDTDANTLWLENYCREHPVIFLRQV